MNKQYLLTTLLSIMGFVGFGQLSLGVDTVYQGEYIDINVTGENVHFAQGTNIVHFTNGNEIIEFLDYTIPNPTTLTINAGFNSSHPIGYYDVTVFDFGTGVDLVENDAFYLAPYKNVPQLDSISLKSGKQGEFVTILIYGTNTHFNEVSYLSLGGIGRAYSQNLTLINDSIISATFELPYSVDPGLFSLTFGSPLDGELTLDGVFELIAGDNTPRIVSLSRDTVLQGEELEIEVTGENVSFNQGTTVVHFTQGNREILISDVVFNGLNTMILNTSFSTDDPSGFYDLRIENWTSGVYLEKEDAIFVKPLLNFPEIESVSKDQAIQGDTFSLTVLHANTNIYNQGTDNVVYLSNGNTRIDASSFNQNSETSLEVEFELSASSQTGKYSLYVENSVDGIISLNDAFEIKQIVLNPTITNLSTPDTVTFGEFLELEVTVADIELQQGSNIIHFNHSVTGAEFVVSDYTINSPTSLTINMYLPSVSDLPIGLYDISLKHYDGDIDVATKENVLFLQADNTLPFLDSISVTNAKQGDTISMFIYGSNTHLTSSYRYFTWFSNGENRIYASDIELIDDNSKKATFILNYGDDIGTYSLFVKNTIDGTLELSDAFEVTEGPDVPRIISVTIDTVYQDQKVDLEIVSERIDFSEGTNTVILSQGDVKHYPEVSFVNESTLSFTETFDDNFAQGYYDITIINSNETEPLVKRDAIFNVSTVITGTEEILENTDRVIFFPNPATDLVSFTQLHEYISLMSLDGQILLEAVNSSELDISTVESGIYLINTKKGDHVISEKLVVE